MNPNEYEPRLPDDYERIPTNGKERFKAYVAQRKEADRLAEEAKRPKPALVPAPDDGSWPDCELLETDEAQLEPDLDDDDQWTELPSLTPGD